MNASDGGTTPTSSRIVTLPNAISALRIALIPAFWVLIVDPDTTTVGLLLFGAVMATDWVDGTIARRTGQVSDVGKVLDPVADRAVILAGLIALVVRGAFPVWAASLIVVRDVAVLVGGGLLLAGRKVRIDVRWVGKLATFSLMTAIPWIAWGTLGLPLAEAALVCGWVAYAVGITEYYVAAWAYLRDIRSAVRSA
jgi:cardiolipin synthase